MQTRICRNAKVSVVLAVQCGKNIGLREMRDNAKEKRHKKKKQQKAGDEKLNTHRVCKRFQFSCFHLRGVAKE